MWLAQMRRAALLKQTLSSVPAQSITSFPDLVQQALPIEAP
jgi:hypothetical protein